METVAPDPMDDRSSVIDLTDHGDPHGVETALGRLNRRYRRSATVPLLITVSLLDDEETVDCIAPGRFEGANGVAVLTSNRLLMVNARAWSPAMVQFPIDPDLSVMGWEESGTAAVVVEHGRHHAVIDRVDREVAHEMVNRLRTSASATA